jgi:L-rhamnose mutarotase
MERCLFYLRIFPGTEAEYDRRHAEIWPELTNAIRASGLRNMSGFRRGTDVWYYLEADPDVKTAFGIHGTKKVNADWNEYFRTIIAEITGPDGDNLWFDEIFHSDGPKLDGPFNRGLFTLVIDPNRATEYEALHANAWPDMLAALADCGFRNYGGFRRGAQVVYYGEFYPDVATVFGKMGQTEVNARWGAAFEGIITTINDADGNLITALEMFHRD